MSDLTRVLAFRSKEEAQEEAGRWKGAGYNVSVILGTDEIRLSDGSQPVRTWESGDNDDWTLIIASKKEIIPL
jgi:hypothetical protein